MGTTGIFEIVMFIIFLLIIIFLAIRCIALTKTLNYYTSLVINLINDNMTKDNIKVIMSAMYGLTISEIERRLKNGS